MVVISTSPGRKGISAAYVDEKVRAEAEARSLALKALDDAKMSKSGGTMTGPIVLPSRTSSQEGGIQLPANSMIGAGTTTANIIGRQGSDTIVVGNSTMTTKMAGKGARPTYNDKNVALVEDIPDISGKQDKIKAGTNVSIGSDGVTISAVDTVYNPATASTDGLMTSAQFTKLKNIKDGAQVNVIESVKVNGTALSVSSKSVNIDLSAYAKKSDLSPNFGLIPVDSLPTSGIRTDAIYLLKASTTGTNNARDEYIYVNSTWEKIGTTQADLSGYLPLDGGAITGGLIIQNTLQVGQTGVFNGGIGSLGPLVVYVQDDSLLDDPLASEVGLTSSFVSNSDGAASISLRDSTGNGGYFFVASGMPGFINSAGDGGGLFAYKDEIPSIDSSLSTTSTRAVQNKVITGALDGKFDKTGGSITGNVDINGTTTFGGNVTMDGSGTPLIIGANGKIGLRAKGASIANAGQINISDSWYGSGGNRWGAQISAYDGTTNRYNQLRVSHEGLQFLIYDNASGSETAQQVALMDDVDAKLANKQNTLTAGSNITINGNTISATNTTYGNATTGAAGLMSAVDKQKLDGIATGATKISVDSTLSSTSTNPLQNKAIKSALDGKLSTSGGGLTGDLYWNDASKWLLPYLLAFKNANTSTSVTYPYTGFYQWGDEWQVNARDSTNTFVHNILSINNVSKVAQFYATPQVNGTNVALTSDLPRITISTSEPSGGQDGDIWFQYEE